MDTRWESAAVDPNILAVLAVVWSQSTVRTCWYCRFVADTSHLVQPDLTSSSAGRAVVRLGNTATDKKKCQLNVDNVKNLTLIPLA